MRISWIILPVVLLFGLVFGATPLLALDNPEKVIEESCRRDWPDNRHMREACVEQQLSVLEKSRSTPMDPRLQLEDLSLIQEQCAKNWPGDVRMRVQCQQQQIRAFQKLQAPPPKGVSLKDYSVAVARCSKEWPDDFRLRARCLEGELAEMRRDQELQNGGGPK
ncbi:MAG TPA: hypothetical protein VFS39_19245 [Nitrospira sp.]|nr:hypothetical protein [Nitrospira sp.]